MGKVKSQRSAPRDFDTIEALLLCAVMAHSRNNAAMLATYIEIGMLLIELRQTRALKGDAFITYCESKLHLKKTACYDHTYVARRRHLIEAAVAWGKLEGKSAGNGTELRKLLPKWLKRNRPTAKSSRRTNTDRVELTEEQRLDVLAAYDRWSDCKTQLGEAHAIEDGLLRLAASWGMSIQALLKTLDKEIPASRTFEVDVALVSLLTSTVTDALTDSSVGVDAPATTTPMQDLQVPLQPNEQVTSLTSDGVSEPETDLAVVISVPREYGWLDLYTGKPIGREREQQALSEMRTLDAEGYQSRAISKRLAHMRIRLRPAKVDRMLGVIEAQYMRSNSI